MLHCGCTIKKRPTFYCAATVVKLSQLLSCRRRHRLVTSVFVSVRNTFLGQIREVETERTIRTRRSYNIVL